MGIRTKLIVGMGMALLISTLLLVTLNIIQMRGLLDTYLLDSALPANVRAIANSVERDFQAPIAASEHIADNSFLIDWMAEGEQPEDLDVVTRYLENIRARHDAGSAHVVSVTTGNYYSHGGIDRVVNRTADPWFYEFLASGKERVLSLDVEKSTGKPTLFINVRMQDERGEALAVSGVGMVIDQVADRIREFRFGETGIVYLVSAEGRINIHPNLQRTNQPLSELMPENSVRSLLGGQGYTLSQFSREGEDFMAASLPLSVADWRVVVEVPAREVYGAANRATTIALTVGVAVALVFLGIVALLASRMTRPLLSITQALTEIGTGGGDLTQRLPVESTDELGKLAVGFNSFVDSQREMIRGLRQTAEQLQQLAGRISGITAENAERAIEQNSLTESVAAAVYEMENTVQEVARNATETASQLEEVGRNSGGLQEGMAQSVRQVGSMAEDIRDSASSIQELAKEIGHIGQVVDVISNISAQTNLLALNAAIEAARAGEHGRGFTVVADEVRSLATKTQSSTDEIKAIIERLQAGSERSVRAMRAGEMATEETVETTRTMGQALEVIGKSVDQVVGMSHQVAAATEEQSTVTEQISRDAQVISSLSARSSEDMKTVSTEVQVLRKLAEELRMKVVAFRLDRHG